MTVTAMMGAGLNNDASWSNRDGCSSPGQMTGAGFMFVFRAMLITKECACGLLLTFDTPGG